MREVCSTRPSPLQSSHGRSITWPVPRQRGQVCETWKKPRELMTWPRPPQSRQVTALEPASAPVPWQNVTGFELGDFDFLVARRKPLPRGGSACRSAGRCRAVCRRDPAPRLPPPKNCSKIPPPPPPRCAENFAEDIERIVEPRRRGARHLAQRRRGRSDRRPRVSVRRMRTS